MHFCAQCVGQTKSPYVCRRCAVFNCPLMERRQLEQLPLNDLKYYIRHRTKDLQAPLNPSKEDLVRLILGRQARVLSERAQRALEEIGLPRVSVTEVDLDSLEPHSSAYSYTGRPPSPSPSGASNTEPSEASLSRSTGSQIRGEVKRHNELKKVCFEITHRMQCLGSPY